MPDIRNEQHNEILNGGFHLLACLCLCFFFFLGPVVLVLIRNSTVGESQHATLW